MGFDLIVRGIKQPTEEYIKKVKAYNALVEAGMDIPDELYDYLGLDEKEEIFEEEEEIKINEAVSGNFDYGDVIVDISKLPAGTSHIVIRGSY